MPFTGAYAPDWQAKAGLPSFSSGGQYGIDIAGIRAGREANANALQQARMAQLGERNKQKRFNTVFPFMKDAFTGMMGQFGDGSGTVGGASGARPHISSGPVTDAQLLSQQIQAMGAKSDMSTQTLMDRNRKLTAAAGFGADAATPRNFSLQMANLQNKTAGELGLRTKTAADNAAHMLQTQQAREAQFASSQDEDIRRRQALLNFFPQLFSAFGGLT